MVVVLHIRQPIAQAPSQPRSHFEPYVHPGGRVIDIGPGMGYFTIPLARVVGPKGHVIAIDVQEKMLSALRSRAKKNGVSERIERYLASQKSFHKKADFILAFWMAHEVPDQCLFFREILDLLKPSGSLLLAEPIVHVPRKIFLAHTPIRDWDRACRKRKSKNPFKLRGHTNIAT